GRRDVVAGDRFPLRRHVAGRVPRSPGAARGGPRLGAKGRNTSALPDRPRRAWSPRGPAPGPLAPGSQAPGEGDRARSGGRDLGMTGDPGATPDQGWTVEVEHRVSGSPDAVFAYFTDPEKHRRWYGVDVGMDPRPGGAYRGMDAPQVWARREYLAVEPAQRLPLP